MSQRWYDHIVDWLKENKPANKTVSIDELTEILKGEKIPKNCKWTNNKNDALSKRCLEIGYTIKKEDNTINFEYNTTVAQDILNEEGTIILNNMYTGRYISSWGNLGHEAINLIKADDDNFYIWLNSMGVCTEIPSDKECTVLMVRSVNSGLYKVIAKAEKCKLFNGAGIPRNKKEAEIANQRYLAQKKPTVTYNGMDPMDEIYHEKDMFATFYTKNVYETVSDIYLTNDPHYAQNSGNIFAKFEISEAMRAYIRRDHEASGTLQDLIDKAEYWKKIQNNDFSKISPPKFNFFKLIQKDHDELAISNALAYFIREARENLFLYKCLKLEDVFVSDTYKMFREKNNIDISFFGEKTVVIIENKIDAGITASRNHTLTNQTNVAYDLYLAKSNQKKDDFVDLIKEITEVDDSTFSENKQRTSQLSKYYIYAVAYLLSKGVAKDDINDRIKCYLLVPKYSEKQFKRDNNNFYSDEYFLSSKYKIITYKELFDFFKDQTTLNNNRYFDDFKSVLETLSSDFNNELEQEMKYRFGKAIKKI